jgi:hypothetical protein
MYLFCNPWVFWNCSITNIIIKGIYHYLPNIAIASKYWVRSGFVMGKEEVGLVDVLLKLNEINVRLIKNLEQIPKALVNSTMSNSQIDHSLLKSIDEK